jgi:hypothetical protein
MGRSHTQNKVSAFNLNPLSMHNNMEPSIEEEPQISNFNEQEEHKSRQSYFSEQDDEQQQQ